jgi:hypothetical protein
MESGPKPEEVQLPYQALVRVNAVVNVQLPNGEWHPRSAFNDNFFLLLRGTNEKEVTDDLKVKLQELKEKWEKDGGSVGLLTP